AKLDFSGTQIDYPLSNDYSILVDAYKANFPRGNLSLSGVTLDPTYEAEEYSLILNKQADWFSVTADRVDFSGFDIEKVVDDKQLLLQKLDINNVNAVIFRDKQLPFPSDQVGKLPQEMIASIPFDLRVDTVRLTGDIAYRELPKDYDQVGEITFNALDAQLLNFTNMSKEQEGIMVLEASGLLMNAGKMSAKAVFLLNDPLRKFSFGGSIKNFSLDSLNKMLVPVANVNIKSGFSENLSFQLSANDTLARGEMTFKYDDLKIQILNAKNRDTQGLGRGIKTFFANTFVVKNKNPSFLVFPRKGVIFQERDQSKAIFNYWGRSLLSGVVSSVGIHKSDKAEKKFEKEIE
ncbi:MAG: hypothetical protein AAF789_10020, partial [Bacteroidota bacterium]